MSSLIAYVRKTIQAKVYWESRFENLKWQPDNEARIKSPMREGDKTPSFYINSETGQWYDHGGSQDGGSSIVSFHAQANGLSRDDAAKDLFQEFIHPVVEDKTIRRWVRQLKETPSLISLISDRFVSPEIRDDCKLGTNGDRIVFPVFNEFGLCVNAKLYKRNAKPKMLSYTAKNESRQFGVPTMIYPIAPLLRANRGDLVVVTEGEWDALVLLSMGILAVSSTNGCKSWPKQYNDLFRGLNVVVAYDNDEEGQKYSGLVLRNLVNIAQTVRKLVVPKNMGKDISDWVKNSSVMRKKDGWVNAFAKAELLVENSDAVLERGEVVRVPLDQASRAEYFGKQIQVEALVTGKDTAPYILPKKVRVSCSRECEGCPLAESNSEFKEKVIDPRDPYILTMIDSVKAQVDRSLIISCGFHGKPSCKCKVDVVEVFNVEQLVLIPTLDDKVSNYVTRNCFFVGHGLKSNSAYDLHGITVPDPEDQHSTHLFHQAIPVQGQIETFELTKEVEHALKKFRPKKENHVSLMRHLNSIAEWQSRNVTHIIHRNDLHIAVDLVFHSVRGFTFNREKVERGMLDALVMGDTRTGKGFVTQGLVNFYGLGEVASGENCSFAGLVGGCESVGKRFIIKWGIIPLNNNRLVVMDEASAISEEEWGKFSRVRSEGVAEISKIVREQTRASCRLLWLANPRSGRPLGSYSAGVQSIKELVGANEDIARFDFVLTVASNEVDPGVINEVHDGSISGDSGTYPAEACRQLVLWAWSRKPEDIVFTDEATREVIKSAIEFGKRYTSVIPLVQAENIRIKIAKISAALAARVFSTEDGKKLIVRDFHVTAACQILRQMYSKSSMGYESYSAQMTARLTIVDTKPIEKAFANLGDKRAAVIRGLLNLNKVSSDSVSDFTGDPFVTRDFIAELVNHSCLTRSESNSYYLKNPAFNSWLRDNYRSNNETDPQPKPRK